MEWSTPISPGRQPATRGRRAAPYWRASFGLSDEDLPKNALWILVNAAWPSESYGTCLLIWLYRFVSYDIHLYSGFLGDWLL